MKGLLVLLTGGLGAGAFWRRFRRRTPELQPGSDPAAALRAKLAESKAVPDPAGTLDEAAPVEALEEPTLDPVSRRRAIHERARGAMDELT